MWVKLLTYDLSTDTTWSHIRHNILYSQLGGKLNKHNVNLIKHFRFGSHYNNWTKHDAKHETSSNFLKSKRRHTVFLCSDATATVYFATRFAQLLFESGYYSRVATIRGRLLFQGGYYSRAATIWGRLLFKGGYYLRVATIPGWLLFEGGYYSRAAFIYLESLETSTTAG